MVQVLCKVWGVGMLSILALTASNILLTMRLLHSADDSLCSVPYSVTSRGWTDALRTTNQTEYLNFLREAAISTARRQLGEIPEESNASVEMADGGAFSVDPLMGRFDSRLRYKIFDRVFTGPDYASAVSSSPVCLATQSSVDRLFWLPQTARHWTEAPMSVAVFTPDMEYALARAYLQYLVTCFPFLGSRVTIHFAFPVDYPPQDLDITLDNLVELCDRPVSVLKGLLEQRTKATLRWREKMNYPQNLLRNVARKNCGTSSVFLTDVDVIPIPNMSKDVSVFLRSTEATSCNRCAFVVPTYEVSEKSPPPHNRTVLLKLVERGLARPFHKKVFVHNQHATNFSRWERREKDFPGEKDVAISHDVTNFEFFYEPFYIAKDDVPPHDERFQGYGFTRNTQVYEMFVAGYQFKVLSPIFTIHWGMQVKKGRPSWRERQNNANRKLFEGFKREVFVRYQRDPLGMMADKKTPDRRLPLRRRPG